MFAQTELTENFDADVRYVETCSEQRKSFQNGLV